MVARYAKKVGAKFVSMTNSDIVGTSLNADVYVITKESAETFSTIHQFCLFFYVILYCLN